MRINKKKFIYLISPNIDRFSAFFFDEKILGSYLSKLFLLIINFYFFLENKKISKFFFILYVLSCLVFLIFSIERMALFIFFMNIFLYFFFQKKYKSILSVLLIVPILVIILIQFVPISKKHFKTFIADIGIIQDFSHNYSTVSIRNQTYIDNPQLYTLNILSDEEFVKKLNVTKKRLNDKQNDINQDKIIYFFDNFHGSIFLNALSELKNNVFFGVGIKNFRKICYRKVLTINEIDYVLQCSTHPHNIYVEILTETGIIGLFLFLMFIAVFLYEIIKIRKLSSELICSTLALFIILIFPIQSTGSFFSSRYMFYYFIAFSFVNYFMFNKKNK